MPKIQTERLILRPWNIADATALYKYAKEPEIGKNAGWAPHKSIDESREIIKTVFAKPKIYAMVLKGSEQPIGCIGLMFGDDAFESLPNGEAEMGFWIGKPFWGKGLTTEAAKALIAHAFSALNIHTIWGSNYNTNTASKKVFEKCGFALHHEALRDDIPTSFWKLEA